MKVEGVVQNVARENPHQDEFQVYGEDIALQCDPLADLPLVAPGQGLVGNGALAIFKKCGCLFGWQVNLGVHAQERSGVHGGGGEHFRFVAVNAAVPGPGTDFSDTGSHSDARPVGGGHRIHPGGGAADDPS